MPRKNGIHDKDVEIRCVIGNDQVWTFRQLDPSQAVYPDSAQKPNGKTPNHVYRETPLPPGNTGKCQENKGIKEQQSDYEDQPHVKLIT